MGTTPLSENEPLIDCDENYFNEITLKRSLLEKDHSYYYKSSEGDGEAQWEVLEKVLSNLVKHAPQKFSLERKGSAARWTNTLLNESHEFTFGDARSLPREPLDWVGRQVQEDLIILNEQGELISGQLCFPAGWSLDEKFGKNMMAIHAPLPGRLNPMIQAASKLMERIPNGHPLQRSNWGIRVCDELDLSPKHSQRYRELLSQSESWDEKTIGEKLFIRIEYQTLSRLSQSNGILFTIHTYLGKVSDEIPNRERIKRFLNYLVSVPPDVLEYKLIHPYSEKLIRYLQMHQTIL